MMQSSYRQSHLAKGSDYDSDLNLGNFDSYMVIHESRILKDVVKSLFPNKVGRYLDFACGTGRILSSIEKLAKTSIGFDVSESMVSEAKEKCTNSTFYITDVTKSAPPEDQFDLVTAFRFFGNAEQELRSSVLRTLSDVTQTGGYLIINNHRNPWSIHELLLRLKGESNNLDLSYANLRELLDTHGFDIEKKIGIGLWVYRYGLRDTTTKSGSFLRHLEPLSRIGFLAPFCPDYLVVAKKR